MAGIFDLLAKYGCEQLTFKLDKKSKLKCILAVKSTKNAKVLNGGTRLKNYASERAAILDALVLANAMDKKIALTASPYAAAKGVIWTDKKSTKLLESFGDFVQSLEGKFLTGADFGLTDKDGLIIRKKTKFIDSLNVKGSLGNSGTTTAAGVVKAMEVTLKRFGEGSLKGKTVAVQGVGDVGSEVVRLLHRKKARVIVCDLVKSKAARMKKKFKAEVVEPKKIYSVECDIFSPCALGEVLTLRTAKKMNCRYVIGAANNQLHSLEALKLLKKRKIVFVPDFAVNIGGLVQSACEWQKLSKKEAVKRTEALVEKLLKRAFSHSPSPEVGMKKVLRELDAGRAL